MKKYVYSAALILVFSFLIACTHSPGTVITPVVPVPYDTTQEVFAGKLWSGYYFDTTIYFVNSGHHRTITDTTLHFIKTNDTTLKLTILYGGNNYKSYYLKYKNTDSTAQKTTYYGDYNYHMDGQFTLLHFYAADSLVYSFSQAYGSEPPKTIQMTLSTHN